MEQNIRYTADEIEAFYKNHRIRWDQFYESERVMMERLGMNAGSSVLDIGCGCAGLGLALKERFGTTAYTGVEINSRAAESGRVLYPESRIFDADILDIPEEELPADSFDFVISLGCIDWNVRFFDMLEKAYSYVRPGGFFMSSFRLTPHESINDMQRSYQHINFEGKKEGEIAPYVVMNGRELVELLKSLHPLSVRGYGYQGKPSATAVTPYENLYFTVIGVQKPLAGDTHPTTTIDLELPDEILASLS